MTTKLSVISTNGLHIFHIDKSDYKTYYTDKSTIYESEFDPSGQFFAYTSEKGVFLLNLNLKEPIKLSDRKSYRKIAFSPKGTFVCFFGIRLVGDDQYEEDKNVSVYRTSDACLVHRYKSKLSETWVLKWTPDEEVCANLQTSEVWFYEKNSFDRYTKKMVVKGVEKISMTQCQKRYILAVYIKPQKNLPHMMKLFDFINLNQPLNNKSFYKCDSISLMEFSPSGRGLLFMSHCDNGKTYYGENNIYYLSIDGESASIAPEDKSQKDPSIHDAFWQNCGNNFVICYGRPTCLAIYNEKCQFLKRLETNNRNFSRSSYCGSILATVGTGGDNGSLQFWDFETFNELGEINAVDVNDMHWSGNDEYVATATLSPSLRVDNGFNLWRVPSTNSKNDLIIDRLTSLELLDNPKEVYKFKLQPELCLYNNKRHHEFCALPNKPKLNYEAMKNPNESKVSAKAYIPPHMRNRIVDTSGSTGDSNVQLTKSGQVVNINNSVGTGQSNKNRKKRNKSKKSDL